MPHYEILNASSETSLLVRSHHFVGGHWEWMAGSEGTTCIPEATSTTVSLPDVQSPHDPTLGRFEALPPLGALCLHRFEGWDG